MEINPVVGESSEHNPKKEIKRPARLDLASMGSHRHKWEECKVYGKNILIRSYAGACFVSSEYSLTNIGSTSTAACRSSTGFCRTSIA